MGRLLSGDCGVRREHFVVTTFLFLITLFYLLFGAWLFHAIEKPHEVVHVRNMSAIAEQFERELGEILQQAAPDNWTARVVQATSVYVERLAEEMGCGHSVFVQQVQAEYKWDMTSSIIFCLTVISTIGYGHVVPVTNAGKIACIIYSLLGIPLFLLFLAKTGLLLAVPLQMFHEYYHRCSKLIASRLRNTTCKIRRRWQKGRNTTEEDAYDSDTEWYVLRSISSADFGLGNSGVSSESLGGMGAVGWDPHLASTAGDAFASTRIKDPTRNLYLTSQTNEGGKKAMPDSFSLSGEVRTISSLVSLETRDGPSHKQHCDKTTQVSLKSKNRRKRKRGRRQQDVPMVFLLVILVAYILGGSAVFVSEEKWSYLDSVYFSMITFSTIGFGDLVPVYGSGGNLTAPENKVVVLCLYVLIGLILMSACLNLSQKKIAGAGSRLLTGRLSTAWKKRKRGKQRSVA